MRLFPALMEPSIVSVKRLSPPFRAMLWPAPHHRAGTDIVEFEWLWELDRKLNGLAMDTTFAVIGAALISEGLRFFVERLLG
jgi:hypothetical protein